MTPVWRPDFAGSLKAILMMLLATMVLPLVPGGAWSGAAAAESSALMPNLPAIALSPSELEQVGLNGFALGSVGGYAPGWMTIGETVGDSVAATDFFDIKARARVNYAFSEVAWLQGYRRVLGLANAIDPTYVDASVVSDVAEYADAASADAALTILMDGGEPLSTDGFEIGARVEARLAMVDIGIDRIVVSFTRDNLVGTVQIFTYSDEFTLELEPALELAERLDQRMVDALERSATGLADMALHIVEPGLPTFFETYWRADGEDYPDYGESAENHDLKFGSFEDAESVYEFQQAFPAPPGDSAPLLYIARLYRFPSVESASEWIGSMPQALADDVERWLGTFEAELIDDAETYGDESLTFSVGFSNGSVSTTGHRIYMRVGADVVRVQIDGETEPSLASLHEMASGQEACLEAGECAGGVAAPEEWKSMSCPALGSSLDGLQHLGVDPTSDRGNDKQALASRADSDDEPAVNWTLSGAADTVAAPAASEDLIVLDSATHISEDQRLHQIRAIDPATSESAWCVTTGVGTPNPVIGPDAVYTMITGQPGEVIQASVAALDIETGEELWRFSIGAFYARLAISDGVVYAATGTGGLWALRSDTGAPIWFTQLDPDDGADYLFSAPVLHDGTIYASAGETLYAFDSGSGEIIWKTGSRPGEWLSAPTIADESIFVGGKTAVYAFELADGAPLWTTDVESDGVSHIAYDDGVIAFSTSFAPEKSAVNALYTADAATGDILWHFGADANVSSPLLEDGVVYIGLAQSVDAKGNLLALSVDTTLNVWSATVDARVIEPTLVAGSLIFAGTDDDHGLFVWSVSAGEPFPAVFDEKSG